MSCTGEQISTKFSNRMMQAKEKKKHDRKNSAL
eukprot:CCRYP_019878-RA/>CCRYP_019878-RA protein AED:0.48 eAED:0.48 QI:102/1/1/1/0/0/3/7/32